MSAARSRKKAKAPRVVIGDYEHVTYVDSNGKHTLFHYNCDCSDKSANAPIVSGPPYRMGKP